MDFDSHEGRFVNDMQSQRGFDHALARETFPPLRPTKWQTFSWRVADLLIAVPLLVVVTPFLLLLIVVMFLSDPGNPFFVHRRIGRAGEKFGCIKLRTMKSNGDELLKLRLEHSEEARREWSETHKLKDDPRVTPIGAIVRKLSLDEFPQLINVIKGEMSLVGPRPIVDAEVEKYGRYFKVYCLVKPGLTGLWQVSGRNDTTYATRVAMDVNYVRHKSLQLDFWLLVKTVPALVFSKGAY